jgi:hypothetical protein
MELDHFPVVTGRECLPNSSNGGASFAKSTWLRLLRGIEPKLCSRPQDQFASMDGGLIEVDSKVQTCRDGHPIAQVSRILPFISTWMVEHETHDRSLATLLEKCAAAGLDSTPSAKLKYRVAYELAEDLSSCTVEFAGDSASQEPNERNHQLTTMRGRRRICDGVDREWKGKQIFEGVGLTYKVPESEWSYVEKIIRESAKSFEVDWNAFAYALKKSQQQLTRWEMRIGTDV